MDTETADEIMEATGRALCEHGYADLTMQRIAEESSLTTAAIHYHFDTKEDLLNAFLEDLIERFERQLTCDQSDPRDRLMAYLDAVFTPPESGDDLPVALMELKAQAPYHDVFRNRFLELDEAMQSILASIVREGIEAGHFEETDPEALARLVTTTINGAHVRTVSLGEPADATRDVVEEYLTMRLGWTPEVVA
ncbi:MAG: TetR/AcrR family transcriptional regulator [Haloferacaceae archaeon]